MTEPMEPTFRDESSSLESEKAESRMRQSIALVGEIIDTTSIVLKGEGKETHTVDSLSGTMISPQVITTGITDAVRTADIPANSRYVSNPDFGNEIIAMALEERFHMYRAIRKGIPKVLGGAESSQAARNRVRTLLEGIQVDIPDNLKFGSQDYYAIAEYLFEKGIEDPDLITQYLGGESGYRDYLKLTKTVGDFFTVIKRLPLSSKGRNYDLDLAELMHSVRNGFVEFFMKGVESGMSPQKIRELYSELFYGVGIGSFARAFDSLDVRTYESGIFAELNARLLLLEEGYKEVELTAETARSLDRFDIDIVCEPEEIKNGTRLGVQVKGDWKLPPHKSQAKRIYKGHDGKTLFETNIDDLGGKKGVPVTKYNPNMPRFIQTCTEKGLTPVWVDTCSDARKWVNAQLSRTELAKKFN